MLATSYDTLMVVVSIIVAFLASYTALDMAGRVVTSSGLAARVWLLGGGFSMGIGIWAMHFIGMLAMNMPMMMSYSGPLTLLSMIIAIAASAAFMTPVSSPVNTLVLGPGGYRFGDFVKIGVPFTLVVMAVSVLLVPLLFPF